MAEREQTGGGFFARLLGRGPKAVMVSAAPESEAGYTVGEQASWWDVPDDEKAPELQWPASIEVYDDMRRQDAQVISVLRAVMLPIRRTPWRIDPNGARPEVVSFVAQNLGLPIVGMPSPPAKRQRDRFSWPEHLQHALLSLIFGHSYFEQTYRIAPDENGVLRAWLRKLGWRPPRTISKIDVAPDGGLIAIEQGRLGTKVARLTVDRLVAYVNEREGGNWLGQSLLRPAYKYWKLKDRMLRTQAQSVDRNGMGIPVYFGPEIPTSIYAEQKDFETAQGADLKAGLRIAKSLRSGRESGAALPNGADMKLLGVEGQLPDADKVIRYYDEQIARAVLANFLNLGGENSTGSYALGSTFADFFVLSLQTTALAIADTATKHIVHDLVDHNFGDDEPAPRIVFDEIGSQQPITADSLRALVEQGLIKPDASLESFLRQTFGLPQRAEEDENGIDMRGLKTVAEVLQKVYLAVGVVISKAEARKLLRDAGLSIEAGDDLGGDEPAPTPTPDPSEGT